MSRVGKQPIPIPQGVEVKLDGRKITVKGPKGVLEMVAVEQVRLEMEEGSIRVIPEGETRFHRAFHGMTRALVNNMVQGVSQGFQKKLEIHGIGYRAAVEGDVLVLQLGHSHAIRYAIPDGIKVDAGKTRDKVTPIEVSGIDKRLVGQVAAEIRAFRPVEPYQGKGVRYTDERVRRKVGKTGV